MNMQDRLRALVEPIVTDLGLELFDLEYSGATLVVTLERRPAPGPPADQTADQTADQGAGRGPGSEQAVTRSGVGIDDITKVTRAVSRALDEADPIAGKYALEVSSPGLERSLRVPAHYLWAVGQKVSVKTVPGFEGGRRLKGELTRAAADSIDVVLDEPAGDTITISYDEIDKARTVFEWGGEPKPAKPAKASAKKPATARAKTRAASAKPTKTSADKRAAKRAAQARSHPDPAGSSTDEKLAKSTSKSTQKSTQKPAPAAGRSTGEVPDSSTEKKTTAAKNSKKVTAS